MSMPGTKCATLNVKDFYLNSKLKECEQVKIRISLILQDFIDVRKPNNIVDDKEFINIEMQNSMLRLL